MRTLVTLASVVRYQKLYKALPATIGCGAMQSVCPTTSIMDASRSSR
jgi:hypothetical protein